MDILIVASDADIPVLEYTIEDLTANMKPSGIKIVTNTGMVDAGIRSLLDEKAEGIIEWIDEDDLYPGLTFAAVKDELTRIMGKEPRRNRTGWYFQQFLKMAYAFRVDEDAYFQMDADVLVLKPLPLTDGDRPCFFVRKEHNRTYFETMRRLLGIDKQIDMSFISETMLFDTGIMKEMIGKIEDAKGSEGEGFWRKILNAIDPLKIDGSGFSEYETYGTYTVSNYPGLYSIKHIPALRNGKRLLGIAPSAQVKEWAAKSYYYTGMEKWDREFPFWKKINNSPITRTIVPARFEAFVDRNLCRISRKWRNE